MRASKLLKFLYNVRVLVSVCVVCIVLLSWYVFASPDSLCRREAFKLRIKKIVNKATDSVSSAVDTVSAEAKAAAERAAAEAKAAAERAAAEAKAAAERAAAEAKAAAEALAAQLRFDQALQALVQPLSQWLQGLGRVQSALK